MFRLLCHLVEFTIITCFSRRWQFSELLTSQFFWFVNLCLIPKELVCIKFDSQSVILAIVRRLVVFYRENWSFSFRKLFLSSFVEVPSGVYIVSVGVGLRF